jgi:hypothetical protein
MSGLVPAVQHGYACHMGRAPDGPETPLRALRRAAFIAVLAALAVGCRSTAPPAGIDDATASCVPPETLLLAGFDVPAIRSSALGGKLPQVEPLLEPYREAAQLLLAFDGRNVLTIARGPFRAAPAGGALAGHGLAISGPDAAVRAAMARLRSGPGAAPGLVANARSVAAGKPIWMVVRGGVGLPLTGNAANLNRLLRDSEFAAVTASLGPRIRVEAVAVGRTPEAARAFEETLRAFLALMAMAEKRGSDVAVLLGAVEIRRQARTVNASVSATPETLGKLLGQ